MKQGIKIIILTTLISCSLIKHQDDNLLIKSDINVNDNKVFEDKTYDKNINTVRIHKFNDQLSNPIIFLNLKDSLRLSFDDFNDKYRKMYYRIIHCDSEWKKTDINETEYLKGFSVNEIYDNENSFNTKVKYRNYFLKIPNREIEITKSGNYIIQIEDDNKILLEKKFYVAENKVNVKGNVSKVKLIEHRNTKQKINVDIDLMNLKVSDPFSEIKLVIKKNNSNIEKIENLKPLFIKDRTLIYDYENESNFWGGNQFRYFNSSSIRYLSDRIDNIIVDSIITFVIKEDWPRQLENYVIYPDINGNFYIDCETCWNSDIESEYVDVKFKLNYREKISYGSVYLIGNFTNWNINENFKLDYDQISNSYTKTIKIKQGYYNYQYLLLDNYTNTSSSNIFEGTHYQTTNDYYIYVYFKKPESRYTRLVGYKKISSKNLL